MAFATVVGILHRLVDVTVNMRQRYALGFAQYLRRRFGESALDKMDVIQPVLGPHLEQLLETGLGEIAFMVSVHASIGNRHPRKGIERVNLGARKKFACQSGKKQR